jgi:chromosome condensin MukBEF ATPase and DNA-binding subunit MukB
MSHNKVISLLSFFRTSPLVAVNFLTRLEHTLKEITMNQAEMKAVVEAANDKVDAAMVQLDKITAEISVLQTSLANTNNTLDPAVEASVVKLAAAADALKAKTQAVDDLNADAVVDATVIDPVAVVEESVKVEKEAKEAKEAKGLPTEPAEEAAPIDMVSAEGNSPS